MRIRSIIHSLSILIFLMGSLLFAMPDRRASLSDATPTGAENETCTFMINYLDDAGDPAEANGDIYFSIATQSGDTWITGTGDYKDLETDAESGLYGVGTFSIDVDDVSSTEVTLGVVADNRYEATEQITITLTNATGSVILAGSPITTATFTLTNDDAKPNNHVQRVHTRHHKVKPKEKLVLKRRQILLF